MRVVCGSGMGVTRAEGCRQVEGGALRHWMLDVAGANLALHSGPRPDVTQVTFRYIETHVFEQFQGGRGELKFRARENEGTASPAADARSGSG